MRTDTAVWGTIVFGLISGGICLIAAEYSTGGNGNYFIWVITAAYGCLLAGWSGEKYRSLIFPIILQLMAACMVPSVGAYALLSVGFLAWLRSGGCFKTRFPLAWVREMVLGAGGLVLIALLMPQNPIAKGMAVWLFFLIQSLYFINPDASKGDNGFDRQRFETAMKKFDRALLEVEQVDRL